MTNKGNAQSELIPEDLPEKVEWFKANGYGDILDAENVDNIPRDRFRAAARAWHEYKDKKGN